MPGKKLKMCRRGIHSFDDPSNVYVTYDKGPGRYGRRCRPCTLERQRARKGRVRPNGRPPEYKATQQQLTYLQMLAHGWSVDEIAERLYVGPKAVISGLHELRRKYGVESNAAAVAQGLKRGAIQPDKRIGKRLPHTNAVYTQICSLRALIQGDREPYRGTAARNRLLDVMLSWHEPHAVSVAWGAGMITSRDVPQTRNEYRRRKRERKRGKDAAVWTSKALGS